MRRGNVTTERLRTFALLLLLVAAGGTGAELVLLEHFEDWWQRVPLAGLGAGTVLTAWVLVRPSKSAVHALRLLAIGLLATGALGMTLHFRGNVEFELELHSSMRGLELVWEALKGATPTLAPGGMAQLGLLGLLACYRHPLLLPRENPETGGME